MNLAVRSSSRSSVRRTKRHAPWRNGWAWLFGKSSCVAASSTWTTESRRGLWLDDHHHEEAEPNNAAYRVAKSLEAVDQQGAQLRRRLVLRAVLRGFCEP